MALAARIPGIERVPLPRVRRHPPLRRTCASASSTVHPPGTKLSQVALADTCVSRTPLREVLRMLQEEVRQFGRTSDARGRPDPPARRLYAPLLWSVALSDPESIDRVSAGRLAVCSRSCARPRGSGPTRVVRGPPAYPGDGGGASRCCAPAVLGTAASLHPDLPAAEPVDCQTAGTPITRPSWTPRGGRPGPSPGGPPPRPQGAAVRVDCRDYTPRFPPKPALPSAPPRRCRRRPPPPPPPTGSAASAGPPSRAQLHAAASSPRGPRPMSIDRARLVEGPGRPPIVFSIRRTPNITLSDLSGPRK